MNTARRRRNGPRSAGAQTHGTARGTRKTPGGGRTPGKARRYNRPACIYFARAVIALSALAIIVTFYALATGVVVAGSAEPQPPIPPLVVEDPAWYVEARDPMADDQMLTCVEPTYSQEELETLALVIYQEAGGDACSDATRQMVGEVFLNRVADKRFPDTFQAVATQRAQYGRLYWTGIKWAERASNAVEAAAVQRSYDMAEALLTGSVERLLPEDVIYQAEFEQGQEIVAESDGFFFCR